MAASSEIKDMLKVAIKEVLEEQRSEATASGENNGYPWIPTPKSKSKIRNQKKTEFDESRKMTPTSGSDPRMLETQWPCHGAHQITYGNNRYGRWGDCLVCGMRMEYIPAVGCPANSCKFDHGPNVIEALERLRSSGWTKDNLEPTTVKHMIKLVSSEKVVTKPKSNPGTSTKKNKPVEEVQVASDDSFELTEDKDKIQAKVNAKAKASPQP